jgi:protein O-mannosyl-transferase
VYREVVKHEFVLMDDALHILDNPHLQKPSFQGLKTLWQAPYQGLYVPVTYTFWGAAAYLSQLRESKTDTPKFSPAVFHGISLFLHSLTSALVFLVLCHIFPGTGIWPSFAGALLFALHPVQVESVAWVSGTKDTVSGFFAVLSILFYLRSQKLAGPGYLASTLFFVLALLSKPSTVCLPLLIFALDRFRENVELKRSLIRLVPWLLISLPLSLATRGAQPEALMRFVPPWWGRPIVAADTLVFYVSKILFPIFLAPDYARNPRAVLGHSWGYVSVLVFLLLALWIGVKGKKVRALSLLFVGALLPVLGIVPFFFQFFSTVADRYLYLAMLGPALAIAWVNSLPHKKSLPVLCTLILLGYGLLTYKQVLIWRNDEKLFTHLVAVNPNSLMGHNNLGTLLEKQDRFDEAGFHYREALRLDPQSMPALYNLGRVCGRQRNYVEAIYLLEKLLKMAPGISEAHYTLGIVYRDIGNLERSSIHLSYATQIEPLLARAHYQLGVTFGLEGKKQAAIRSLDRALELNPLLTAASTVRKQILESSPLRVGKNTSPAIPDRAPNPPQTGESKSSL